MTYSPLEHAADLDDPGRLAALARTGLMDTPPELPFDRLTRLACRLLTVPAALLTLVDHDRAFVKSAQGLSERWRARQLPSLAHTLAPDVVRAGAPLAVDDLSGTVGPGAPIGTPDLGVVAYAGVPVSAPGGHIVGALAVVDTEPRAWREDDISWLMELAGLARTELELRELAGRDSLVGLATARQLEVALAGRLATAELTGEPCALVRIDVAWPDHGGHRCRETARARVLAAIARRLLARLDAQDLLARLDGDAFAVVVAAAVDEGAAQAVCDGLEDAFAQPVMADGIAVTVTARVGVATSVADRRPQPRDLLGLAAAAARDRDGGR